MATEYTRKEKAILRQLASEAWESQLDSELDQLFESFCTWANKGISAFDLSDQIHAFHNGVSRELYKRYTSLPHEIAVARAVVLGLASEESIEPMLLEKLRPLIEAHHDWEEKYPRTRSPP